MQKSDFLQQLQERAKEQQLLHKDIPFPHLFSFLALHLGNHPWQPLIPLSVFASVALYFLFGNAYIEFVLSIFKLFR